MVISLVPGIRLFPVPGVGSFSTGLFSLDSAKATSNNARTGSFREMVMLLWCCYVCSVEEMSNKVDQKRELSTMFQSSSCWC
mmetsp:Transcript_26019/g.56371  ORF Transcript_26019/g.56371 Transcript_26019/m.56371 type:complete len:82 (+) Transcript_26019:91-336(+)